jgi:tetratricopeptide (TPR) repeat protein
MTFPDPEYGTGNDSAMMREPHLFFAEVSLDISRGRFQSGIDKLKPYIDLFSDSYLFCLLYAKAQRGINNYAQAGKYLRKCCTIAPANQIAWQELIELQAAIAGKDPEIPECLFDPVTDELEKLTAALMEFEPVKTTENADPTPILEQKQPFSDDTAIAVPTESLATLFTAQGAYKKAIKIYTLLIPLKPQNADFYQKEIDSLLERL